MNNAFNYQNDLTGFRSQLSEITKNHDNAVANAAAVAIGTKSRLIQKAKDLKEAGDSLVKQGLEAEIVPTAGAAIYKGGRALYGKVAQKLGGAADEVAESGGNSIESISSSAGNEGASAVSQGGEVELNTLSSNVPTEPSYSAVARPSNPNVNSEFRSGQGRDMEQFRSQPTEGAANNTGADAAQTDTDGSNIRSRVGQAEGETKEADMGDLGGDVEGVAGDAENALSSAVSGASDAAEAASSAASSAASAAASGASDLAGAAASGASDLASGLSGAASGLEEAAAATSWIPFVGEIMGGVAAAAALGAAGYGAYEEIKGAIQEGQAEGTKIMPKPVAPADVAGSFIAPQQSSQES